MLLPPSQVGIPDINTAAAELGHGSKNGNGGWSSLIGVVTAICGNILISFALNTQRYAHLRLSRDRESRQQDKARAAPKRHSPRDGYGTSQHAIADQRAADNAKPEEATGNVQEAADATETAPLIPKLRTRTSSGAGPEVTQDDEAQDGNRKEKSYLRSPIWWVGIILMVVGETGNFLAYGFAPASIVSPLGVVALISNCIIAPLFLGEQFRWRDALGVLIAVGGCVTVVLSASSSNPKLTPEAIWGLVTTWEFETYLGITLFLIVVLMLMSNKFGHKSILIDIGLVGLFGGYTALSTKGVASLLTYKIWRVVTFPITYLLVAVLVLTAVMQIKYINRGLQRFNSTMVIPTQFVLFTISVIVGSAVLYRDFERETTEDAIKFVCGCALTFFGVWCITSGRGQDSEDEDSQPGDEEDAIDLIDEEGVIPEIRESNDSDTRQSSFAAGSSYAASSMRRYHSTTNGSLAQLHRAVTAESDAVRTSSTHFHDDAQPLLLEQMAHLAPADASAIHTTTMGPLSPDLDNNPQKKPPLHATTSDPLIPTALIASTPVRPQTPLTRTPSNPVEEGLRKTPSHTAQYLDPNAAHRLLPRSSVVGLMPGPLTSPLSGSLSAIVADELRKGTDRSLHGSLRRRRTAGTQRLTTRAGADGAALGGRPKRHSIASVEFENGDAADLRGDAGSPSAGRIRSLSATLSDLFGSGSSGAKRQRILGAQEERRQQSRENDHGGDEDATQ